MDKIDFLALSNSISNQANFTNNMFADIERRNREQIQMVERANREVREQRARDSRNLEILAENSVETVDSLKEMNQTLKESNNYLREQNKILNQRISDISDILNALVDESEENAENREKLMQQMLALAVEMNVTLDDVSSGVNWKGTGVNSAVTGVFMGLQCYLHQKGLL